MRVAVDVTPIKEKVESLHKFRGTGSYIELLKENLNKYGKNNSYIFFTRGEPLSSNIEIIHYPYFEPFFLTLPFKNNYKTVVTVHDLIPLLFRKHFPIGFKGYIKWQLQRLLLKKANAIITDSKASKKDIVRLTNVSENKVYVVYLAVREEFQKIQTTLIKDTQYKTPPSILLGDSSKKVRDSAQKIIKKYNIPEKFVLYVGDVTWNKNLPRLVEAIKKINVTLVMAGRSLVQNNFDSSHPWNQDLVKVLKLTQNDKRFIRVGFLSTEDLVMLYNMATVFTMPSLYEGFGLPVLEAMTCGCPVVTSRESSLPEVAGDAAWYVDAYSSESIANGIGEVFFNSKLLQELSKKAYLQAKKFSVKKMIEETLIVYEDVISG